ncbi:hypothetical protein F8388_011405 [Cannabis sativa]|uniref:Uncharacterized protein n=1 Tax=Cannabis sativa TaxID=3483 RepID=A0A7J6EW17_CANSA|nr:hypothetical protein F8388_011405 [Cannabis sativa]
MTSTHLVYCQQMALLEIGHYLQGGVDKELLKIHAYDGMFNIK